MSSKAWVLKKCFVFKDTMRPKDSSLERFKRRLGKISPNTTMTFEALLSNCQVKWNKHALISSSKLRLLESHLRSDKILQSFKGQLKTFWIMLSNMAAFKLFKKFNWLSNMGVSVMKVSLEVGLKSPITGFEF